MTSFTKNPVSKAKKPERSAIIISIRPMYAEQIWKGTKKYELRRNVAPMRQTPELFVVYETAPVRLITGFFNCYSYTSANPRTLWTLGINNFFDNFSEIYGVSHSEFQNYFAGTEKGHAIEISEFAKIKPLALNDIGLKFPPQNLQYLNLEQWNIIFERQVRA